MPLAVGKRRAAVGHPLSALQPQHPGAIWWGRQVSGDMCGCGLLCSGIQDSKLQESRHLILLLGWQLA